MKAKVGDWLVMKGFTIDKPEQRGLITEVHSEDGSPPYVVQWLDNGHVLYHFAEERGLPEVAVNVWVSPTASGATEPRRVLIRGGLSPAVVPSEGR